MAPSTFTVTYSKPGTVPPIFVAGSFTSQPWEPQELDHDGEEGSGSFSRTFSVDPGTYQYKFRLGTGDWWVVDETQKTDNDGQGNVNNVLLVKNTQQISTSPATATTDGEEAVEIRPADTDTPDNFPQAGEPELPPAVPVSEISVQAEDGPATSLSSTLSAAAAKVAPPVKSVSYDLPTPPISEGGDDVGGKDVPPDHAEDLFQNPEGSIETSKRSEEKTSSGSAPGWSLTGIVLLALGLAVVPIVAWSLRQ